MKKKKMTTSSSLYRKEKRTPRSRWTRKKRKENFSSFLLRRRIDIVLLCGGRVEFDKLFKCFAAAIIVWISWIKSKLLNDGNANWRTPRRIWIVSILAIVFELKSSFNEFVGWSNCGAFFRRYWIVVWINKSFGKKKKKIFRSFVRSFSLLDDRKVYQLTIYLIWDNHDEMRDMLNPK